jgi:hypothetical protein
MKQELLYYPAQQLQLWKVGELSGKWHNELPDLFKDEDLRHVQNQPYAHFGEWFTAIHYWKQRYRVLIEKYVFPKAHPKACSTAKDLLGVDLFRFLCEHARSCQPPDLLVYRPNFQSFFFVEVKLGHDHLRPSQKAHFECLEQMTRQEVVLVNLKPEPKAGTVSGSMPCC